MQANPGAQIIQFMRAQIEQHHAVLHGTHSFGMPVWEQDIAVQQQRRSPRRRAEQSASAQRGPQTQHDEVW